MSKQLEIFNPDYISPEQTKTNLSETSEFEKFKEDPITKEDLSKYGTSKPKRVIIKAKITNG